MNENLKLVLQCVACFGLLVFLVNQCVKAEGFEPMGIIEVVEDDSTMELIQHLYDRAIYEIEKGDRVLGCKKLHEAFAHSMNLDDNWKTYNQIWSIGTLTCNWTLRSDTMETSN